MGSCKKLSIILFPEIEHSLQGWGQDADVAVRGTEERAVVTVGEHAIYRAEAFRELSLGAHFVFLPLCKLFSYNSITYK